MTRGGDGTLITSTTSLTSPFVSSTSPVTNTTTISTNTNNIDYFNHFNSSGFNITEMNSMSNKISLVLKIVMKRIKGDDSSSNLVEATDATFTIIVTTSTMYTVSTTVSINTTVISIVATAAAKAS
uniref:Uncharacterized protein n=1 Tax=Rhizophagus irregularis (strain DAOM 181602 / DAOM 197198 / MUCL 43194) TaxID=747089 RepID=U9TSX0_RHIID